MMLRMQLERQGAALFPSRASTRGSSGWTAERLAPPRPDAIVMHPGPMNRGVEITSDVADRAAR